ncbi:2S albumin-like [Chenopodium quinoa]|nr:2S albumin-like [Chenopodium quinoa]
MAITKFVILAAVMAALVVMTHATIITTEVEIEDDFEQGRGSSSQCRRQLRSQWPNHCEQYMMQGMRRYMGRDEDDNQGSQQYLEKCCDDLKMMRPQCQCEAMKMIVEEKGMMHEQRMMEKAMNIPRMCGTMQRKCRMSYME